MVSVLFSITTFKGKYSALISVGNQFLSVPDNIINPLSSPIEEKSFNGICLQ